MSSFSFFHLHCLLVLFHKRFCFLLLTTLLPCLASRVFFLLPSLLVLFHKCFSLTHTIFLSCFMSTFFFSLLLTLSSCPVSWVCWWTHTTPPWRTGWEVVPPVASSLPLTCWTQCPPCTPTKTRRTSQSAICLAMNGKSSSTDTLNTMPFLPTPEKIKNAGPVSQR